MFGDQYSPATDESFQYEIPGGLQEGDCVEIKGVSKGNFLNLRLLSHDLTSPLSQPKFVEMPLNLLLKDRGPWECVSQWSDKNVKLNGQASPGLEKGKNFLLQVASKPNTFLVKLNQRELCDIKRFCPYDRITHLNMTGNVDYQSVEFKDADDMSNHVEPFREPVYNDPRDQPMPQYAPSTNVNPKLAASIPTPNVPTINLPDQSIYGTGLQKPKLTMPTINGGQAFNSPDFNVSKPSVNYNTPTFSSPSVNLDRPDYNVRAPDLNMNPPNVNLRGPDLNVNPSNVNLRGPEFDRPGFSGPDVNLPNDRVNMPQYSGNAPKFTAPSFNMPSMSGPRYNPDLSAPGLQLVKPNIQLPDFPRFSSGSANLQPPKPDIPLPGIQMPNLTGLKPTINKPQLSLPKPSGELRLPELNLPNTRVNVPDVSGKLPSLPNLKAQNLSGPNFQGPSFSGPNIDMPHINKPSIDMPDIRAPNIRAPNLSGPNINMPKLNGPNIDMPDIQGPNFKSPTFSGPNINMPDLQGPNFKSPTLSGPNINMPDIQGPNLKAPTFSSPNINMPKINAPNIQGPDLGIKKPNFKLPRLGKKTPNLDGDLNLQAPRANLNTPNMQLNGPNFQGPNMNFEGPDYDANIRSGRINADMSAPNATLKKSKFNFPAFKKKPVSVNQPNLTLPSGNLSGPNLSRSTDNLKGPDIQLVNPYIRMPRFGSPRVRKPTMNAPNYSSSTPNLNANLPDYDGHRGNLSLSRPDFDRPNLSLNTPDSTLPSFKGNLSAPDYSLGRSDLNLPNPTIDLPRTSGPNLHMQRPGMQMPKFNGSMRGLDAGLNMPDMSRPNLDYAMNKPDINLPNSHIEMPRLNSPNFNVRKPDINMPRLEKDMRDLDRHVDLPSLQRPNFNKPDLNGPNLEYNKPKLDYGLPDTHIQLPNLSGNKLHLTRPLVEMPRLGREMDDLNRYIGHMDLTTPHYPSPKTSVPKPDLHVPTFPRSGGSYNLDRDNLHINNPDIQMTGFNQKPVYTPSTMNPNVEAPKISTSRPPQQQAVFTPNSPKYDTDFDLDKNTSRLPFQLENGRTLKLGSQVPRNGDLNKAEVVLHSDPEHFPEDEVKVAYDFKKQKAQINAVKSGKKMPPVDVPNVNLQNGDPFNLFVYNDPKNMKIKINNSEPVLVEHNIPLDNLTHITTKGGLEVENLTYADGLDLPFKQKLPHSLKDSPEVRIFTKPNANASNLKAKFTDTSNPRNDLSVEVNKRQNSVRVEPSGQEARLPVNFEDLSLLSVREEDGNIKIDANHRQTMSIPTPRGLDTTRLDEVVVSGDASVLKITPENKKIPLVHKFPNRFKDNNNAIVEARFPSDSPRNELVVKLQDSSSANNPNPDLKARITPNPNNEGLQMEISSSSERPQQISFPHINPQESFVLEVIKNPKNYDVMLETSRQLLDQKKDSARYLTTPQKHLNNTNSVSWPKSSRSDDVTHLVIDGTAQVTEVLTPDNIKLPYYRAIPVFDSQNSITIWLKFLETTNPKFEMSLLAGSNTKTASRPMTCLLNSEHRIAKIGNQDEERDWISSHELNYTSSLADIQSVTVAPNGNQFLIFIDKVFFYRYETSKSPSSVTNLYIDGDVAIKDIEIGATDLQTSHLRGMKARNDCTLI